MYIRSYILIFCICARVWVLKLLILIPRSLLIEFSYTHKKEVGNATNENRFCLVSVSDLKIHSYWESILAQLAKKRFPNPKSSDTSANNVSVVEFYSLSMSSI